MEGFSFYIIDQFINIKACLALIRMVPAQNRAPDKYYMQPQNFQTSSKYQPSSNAELFYPDPRIYDRSVDSTKEQSHHSPETPEIPSNTTVSSSTQFPNTAPTNNAQQPAEEHFKDSRLQQMVQQLYMAQGQVNLISNLLSLQNSSFISGSIRSSRNSTCPNGGISSPAKP